MIVAVDYEHDYSSLSVSPTIIISTGSLCQGQVLGDFYEKIPPVSPVGSVGACGKKALDKIRGLVYNRQQCKADCFTEVTKPEVMPYVEKP